MSEEDMWNAISTNDESYDGVFCYAVKTTKIYCRPSCKSKTPKRTNVCFFANGNEAKEAGFRACKRCRSDLLEYQPNTQMAEQIKALLEAKFHDSIALNGKLMHLGLTQHRMVEIFKEKYGMTLNEYRNLLRFGEATKRLVETDETIIEIAHATGFSSLSSFYRFFQNGSGVTPNGYRSIHRHSHQNK